MLNGSGILVLVKLIFILYTLFKFSLFQNLTNIIIFLICRNQLLQKEYDEFVTESKQYELMLNTELEQKSSKLDRCERELIRLRADLEASREKYAALQQSLNIQTNNLQVLNNS